MNCPNCKNPVDENVALCEWCGSSMNATNTYTNYTAQSTPTKADIELFIKWEGKFVISFNKIDVIVDGRSAGKGAFSGFEIGCKTNNPRPEITLKSGFISRTIILPNDVYFIQGNSYLIDLEWSNWNNFITNKPKSVNKIK
jgi:hypothetical protein